MNVWFLLSAARSRRFANTSRSARSRRLSALLFALVLSSAIVIEALHSHACTGDGCVLCLAITMAQVLLGISLGVAIARPIVWILARQNLLLAIFAPPRLAQNLRFLRAASQRAGLTPVTMGVRLLI